MDNKILLITGGTGSFGNALLERISESNIREIRIFSRDEKKQDDMRQTYKNNKIKYYLGDVRDKTSLVNAVRGVDYIFHAAALKQVPSCEFYPLEAVNTNIIGTENVLEVAIENNVKKVVCLSTDKAVYPINAMGISKAMMEKIAIAKSRNSTNTIINVTRYGNVMCSRGSVIPLFVNQILNNKPITVTDPLMTRFMMSLDDALNLVLFAFKNGRSGEIFVHKAPSADIETLIKSLLLIFDKQDHKINIIGTRHGEKLYETLLSREEMSLSDDLGDYFRVPPDMRELNYSKFIDTGEILISNSVDFNSHDNFRLDVNKLKEILSNLSYIKSIIN